MAGCTVRPTPQELRRRLSRATAEPDVGRRDQSLKWVALDAADAGEADIAIRAAAEIRSIGLLRAVADAAADRLEATHRDTEAAALRVMADMKLRTTTTTTTT
ncbi:MAG TPA: hypothetical protein VK324_02610, partial [Tepidisphaeraceae bacterium]|nr:hypothetical protein [Tepidisphaeraceae bacterium]